MGVSARTGRLLTNYCHRSLRQRGRRRRRLEVSHSPSPEASLSRIFSTFPHDYSRRFSSSASSEEQQHRNMTDEEIGHLERLTHYILNTAALGTLTADQMQQAATAIQLWRTLDTGHGMDSADLLVERLVVERCASSVSARKHLTHGRLVELQRETSSTWLNIGVEAALDRAELLWKRSKFIQYCQEEDSVVVAHFRVLVERRLNQGTYQSSQRAAELLLHYTTEKHMHPDECNLILYPNELTLLFHQTLQQCVELHPTMETPRRLLGHMQHLATLKEYKWTRISPSNDLQRVILDQNPAPSQEEPNDDGAPIGPSSFEHVQLQKQFVAMLQDATMERRNEMEQVLHKITSTLASGVELLPELCRALVDYHVRIEDANEASRWLQRFAILKDVEPQDLGEAMLSVFELWTANNVPWRAHEIVTQLLEIEAIHGLKFVDTKICNSLLQCWTASEDTRAAAKVQEIFSGMRDASQDDSASKAPNFETYHTVLALNTRIKAAFLHEILSSAMESWTRWDETERIGLVEELFKVLAASGMASESMNLMQFVFANELPMTEAMLMRILSAHLKSRDPTTVVDAIQTLESKLQKPLPLKGYGIATTSLVKTHANILKKDRAEKWLVERILDLSLEGKFDCTAEEVTELLDKVIRNQSVYQKRSQQADNTLRYIESKTLTTDSVADSSAEYRPPVSHFNHVMKGWAVAGNINKMRKTFQRLLAYYHNGYAALLPDLKSFGIYLWTLEKVTHQPGIAQEAEEILEQMIELYKTTGNDVCKPVPDLFHAVLSAVQKKPGEEAVSHSMALLDRMQAIDVRPETFTLTTVMNTILKSSVDDPFKSVTGLADQMVALELEPSNFTHRFILEACSYAKSADRDDALKRAITSLRQLRDSNEVDTTSIIFFLNCLRYLLPIDDIRREKLVDFALHETGLDGNKSQALGNEFRSMLSQASWDRLSSSRQVSE